MQHDSQSSAFVVTFDSLRVYIKFFDLATIESLDRRRTSVSYWNTMERTRVVYAEKVDSLR
jgi:hypothetical protein